MKPIIIAALFAGILAGCETVDSLTQRLPGGSEPSSGTPVSGPNAVTRNPAPSQVAKTTQTERRLPSVQPEAAPPAIPPQATQAPVTRTPDTQTIDPSIDPATARSYSATWEENGYRYRSVMFPHVIDGCKVMIQSRRSLDYVSGSQGEFVEREGSDCNCDLMLDGKEFFFGQLNDEYKTPRMLAVCQAPGVDGATRQLEIMREGLKEDRNFDKMKNVEGF